MQIDRRAFLATLGTAATINAMPSEALADAYVSTLGLPTSPHLDAAVVTEQINARIVGNSYLGITSGLLVIRPQSTGLKTEIPI